MKKTIVILSAAVLSTGCATTGGSASFFQKETAIHGQCLASVNATPTTAWIVDPITGRSPSTDSVLCYRNGLREIVAADNYQNAALVERYADYLVALSADLDKGIITVPVATAQYAKARTWLSESISNADKARDAENASAVSTLILGMGAVAATTNTFQDLYRPSYRPMTTTCTPGMHKTSPVTCVTH